MTSGQLYAYGVVQTFPIDPGKSGSCPLESGLKALIHFTTIYLFVFIGLPYIFFQITLHFLFQSPSFRNVNDKSKRSSSQTSFEIPALAREQQLIFSFLFQVIGTDIIKLFLCKLVFFWRRMFHSFLYICLTWLCHCLTLQKVIMVKSPIAFPSLKAFIISYIAVVQVEYQLLFQPC